MRGSWSGARKQPFLGLGCNEASDCCKLILEPLSRGPSTAAITYSWRGGRPTPCNRDKGSRSLGQWLTRLLRAGDALGGACATTDRHRAAWLAWDQGWRHSLRDREGSDGRPRKTRARIQRVGRSRDAGGGANWVAHQAILCRARLSRTIQCAEQLPGPIVAEVRAAPAGYSNAGRVSKIAWGERTTILH
jgi:hypothetical protein